MRKFIAVAVLLSHQILLAQNVGIGVQNPQEKLTVDGGIMLDVDQQNNGSLDSFALVFGHERIAGIAYHQVNGMRFHSGGQSRFTVLPNGNVGVGTTSASYKFNVNGNMRASSIHGYSAGIGNPNLFNNDNDIIFQVNDGYSYFDGKVRINNFLKSSAHFQVKGLSILDGDVQLKGESFMDTAVVYDQLGVGNIAAGYKFRVWGNAKIDEGLSVDGNMGIGGTAGVYKFRLYGDARIDSSMRVDENFAVGGSVDFTKKLRVKGGDAKFDGDVIIDGNLEADKINGHGVVTSNGNSPLQMGFNSKAINLTLGAGVRFDHEFSISDFEGSTDNVRVMIAQFIPDPHPDYVNWSYVTMAPHIVDAAANTALIRFTNQHNAQVKIKGTLYIMSVARL